MRNQDVKEKLNQLKIEAAKEIGFTQFIQENNDHYKGNVPSKVNGAQGGPIGGQMVKMMIQAQEEKMKNQIV